MSHKLAISIVNWRCADLTIDCLQTIAKEIEQGITCQVYVVDNASGDDSVNLLQQAIEDNDWQWAQLLEAHDNGGFAAGNNVAFRAAKDSQRWPEYFLLLNPDTLVRANALSLITAFLDDHPEVGIVGGRSEDPDATPQACCFRFPTPLSEFATYINLGVIDRMLRNRITRIDLPEEALEVGWVSGAHMLVRSEIFDQIGLFDERYFLYFEETDFILRAKRMGWDCWHYPDSRVVHLVGQTSGRDTRGAQLTRTPAYWFESRRRYFHLNHGALGLLAADLAALTAVAISSLRQLLQPSFNRINPHFLTDLFAHSIIRHPFRETLTRKISWRDE